MLSLFKSASQLSDPRDPIRDHFNAISMERNTLHHIAQTLSTFTWKKANAGPY